MIPEYAKEIIGPEGEVAINSMAFAIVYQGRRGIELFSNDFFQKHWFVFDFAMKKADILRGKLLMLNKAMMRR